MIRPNANALDSRDNGQEHLEATISAQIEHRVMDPRVMF